MNNIIALIKEQWINRVLIWKLSFYNYKSTYARHYLGVLWVVLMPLLQAAVFWFVFGVGIRRPRGDVGDLPFIVHLLSGIFPWGFITACVTGGAMAILSKVGLVTKMKFPSSILISITILGNIISLVFTTLIIMVISFINDYSSPIHYVGVLYFVFATVMFTFGLSLILSSVVIIIRDVKNVIANVMRLFFFMTPIIWTIETATPIMKIITEYNPFAYLVMTYRTSLVYSEGFIYGDWSNHLYFWSLTILLFFIGVQIHYRFRDKFVDYLR
ncbi:ABC transporter permease [Salinicoccus sp. YB14-2]|uniref:ABC transporter permease n=1 Tax=Salinicoccus sp. YB14-2 TaxID=1572701 RepID=UPI0006897589|nr:ABC transporter permease [Salinicoccus sp. YB14-2]